MLKEVGGLESQPVHATAQAMRELDVLLAGHRAGVAVVISPHSPSSMTSLPVRHSAHLAGDLARFRAPQVRVEAIVDTALVTALVGDAHRAGYALIRAEESDLDHGVVVPLYSLPQAMANQRCVFLGVSGWPLARFFDFGAWLHQRLLGRSVILLASGDLSHRLTPDAPYGFRPEGHVFDRLVIDALRDSEWERIEGMDRELIEEAGECGLRPLAILLGAARAAGLSSKVLSYEGPFGVGYPVVAFTPAAGGFDIQDFGRRAIETYLRSRQLIDPPQPIPAALQKPAALFVTLRKGRELRGCVGSLRPTEPMAAHELIRYAVASAFCGPRLQAGRVKGVGDPSIKVPLLGAPGAGAPNAPPYTPLFWIIFPPWSPPG